MKTYIFSNCAKTDPNKYGINLLAKVPREAHIIILNKGEVYYKVKEFRLYKQQSLIMRKCDTHGFVTFFGIQDLVCSDRRICFKDVIAFDPEGEKSRVTIGHYDNTSSSIMIDSPWFQSYRNETKKDPTTGYCSYFLVQQLYGVKPEDIVLVNFYGNADNSTKKWVGHNWSYEDKWLQNKQRIFI